MSGLPEVGLRLLDPRLTAGGFPRWGSAAAAGLDLHACLDAPLVLPPRAKPALIPAGFSVLIRDPDWCGLIVPRSGRGHRDGLVLGNGTGVIDADYEGPLMVSAWNRNDAEPGPASPSRTVRAGRAIRVKTSWAIRSPGSIRTGSASLRFQAETISGPS